MITISWNWTAFATILTALATIVLAIITYNSQVLNKKQLLILKNQQSPLLSVGDFSISNNEITLKIKNIGSTPAIKVGLYTHFLFQKFDSDKNNYYIDIDQIVTHNNETIYSNGAVNFWKTPSDVTKYIASNEEKFIIFEPKFFVNFNKDYDNNLLFESSGQTISLTELINIAKNNNKNYINIRLQLWYKDTGDNMQDEIGLQGMIFDINKDKTLEDSAREVRFDAISTITQNELESITKVTSEKMYRHVVSAKKYIKI